MAMPIFIGACISLCLDREAPGFHGVKLDRGGLEYTYAGCAADRVATSEIAAFVEQPWGVDISDRDGRCLFIIYTRSSPFVARRLRSALARVREARSYRT